MRRWAVVLVVAGVAALLVGRWVATVAADWAWYDAAGALDVYRASLGWRAAWFAGAGAVAFAFTFANVYALRRSIVSLVLPRRVGNLEIGEAVPDGALLAVVVVIAAIVALILAAPPVDWTSFAFARAAAPFREMDPYLDRDLSYAVAWVPVEVLLHDWASELVVVVAAGTVVLYLLTPSLRIGRGGVYVSVYCRRHLAVLAACAIAMLAWSARIDAITMTAAGGATGDGFGAYDLRVGLPLAIWRASLTGVGAFVVLWAGWNGFTRVAALAGLAVAVVGPAADASAPWVARRGFTAAELVERDRSFASTRRLFTRRAFGVDEVAMPGAAAARTSHRAPAGVVWDAAALIGTVRGGRDAPDRPAGWLLWPAEEPAVVGVVASRDAARADAVRVDWYDAEGVDERHHPLASVGPPGFPAGWDDLLVHDSATGWRVVADSTRVIAAPAFGTRAQRIAHAWRLRSPSLAFRDGAAAGDRIVYRRAVRERVDAIVPFLRQGPTLAATTRGDSLVWIVDLFTTSAWYPLADRVTFAGEAVTYAHAAARAFVNAATGRVRVVALPRADAILRTWMRRFPGVIEAPGPSNAELTRAAPPMVDWLALQAEAFARTGLDGHADAGRVAIDNADVELAGGAPPVFRGADGALASSATLLTASGDVAGVMTMSAGESRWAPAAAPVPWTRLLDDLQRAADSVVSPRTRRSARRGRVTASVDEGGLALVQSQYDWPSDGVPSLVAVSAWRAGGGVAARSVEELRGNRGEPGGPALRRTVAAIHRAMTEALRRGDWVAFGAALDALGRLAK